VARCCCCRLDLFPCGFRDKDGNRSAPRHVRAMELCLGEEDACICTCCQARKCIAISVRVSPCRLPRERQFDLNGCLNENLIAAPSNRAVPCYVFMLHQTRYFALQVLFRLRSARRKPHAVDGPESFLMSAEQKKTSDMDHVACVLPFFYATRPNAMRLAHLFGLALRSDRQIHVSTILR
jgi:hypothetical protein